MGDPEVKVAHVTAIRRKRLKAAEARGIGGVLKEIEQWALGKRVL